jgi:hypothetical protein
MCAQDPAAFTKFPPFAYTVQRIWSNASAMAGQDPCLPLLPSEVYFNSAPELSDTINLNLFGQSLSFTGVTIPVGSTTTIPLDLFSTAPTTGPWRVTVQDFSQLMQGPQELQLSLDNTSGSNGDKLNLTIKVEQASQYGAELFFIVSSLNGQEHYWIGAVGN